MKRQTSSISVPNGVFALDNDDDLRRLETDGVPALPSGGKTGMAETDGANIWFAKYGSGHPVVLLHGGMGNSGNWAFLVPELLDRNYSVIVIDSRGQGRSSWDGSPFSYNQMAADVCAVLDRLNISRVAIVGWSDGADIGLALADETPELVAGLFFFACNVDQSGTKPFKMTPAVERILVHHKRDYAALSPAPDEFETVFQAIQTMQSTQPNYSHEQLARIHVPITVCLGEHDEFIPREHLEDVAKSLPKATFVLLSNVSHFAPLQRAGEFNTAVVKFLDDLDWHGLNDLEPVVTPDS